MIALKGISLGLIAAESGLEQNTLYDKVHLVELLRFLGAYYYFELKMRRKLRRQIKIRRVPLVALLIVWLGTKLDVGFGVEFFFLLKISTKIKKTKSGIIIGRFNLNNNPIH